MVGWKLSDVQCDDGAEFVWTRVLIAIGRIAIHQ
jgi:hypothetical protein